MMSIPLRWISRFVIGYLLLAFFWWAVHLWTQNDLLFQTEYQLLEMRFSKNNRGYNETQLQQTVEYQTIIKKRDKRRRMIVAEGLFFTACLSFGLFQIHRSAKREVALTRQRRNFLLSITHELKSPIASLRLILETFSKHSLNREQSEQLASNGLRESGRLQSLVESMLLAARLEDNWRPLFEPFSLQTLTAEIIQGLKLRFPQAVFTATFSDDFPLMYADKSGMGSVVQNLLENAVKYSSTGSAIELNAWTEGGKFIFQVKDHGKGVPENERQAIFEKFYRIGNEETRNSQGTGLGLYIVRQVIKAHGGQIQISSNTPQGTIFTIVIGGPGK
jgi:two-component system phosphate regulon sensor histidine kinase PhoR